ncbi:hypothetical protein B0J18DRAFT_434001 [Chaetomium sp. MPI-SDFR-AT-0129]|nr:hypothetical protein B0J18DRAFT_434001 [Chaetomium sp. MPI-SDFR-AT-0129]
MPPEFYILPTSPTYTCLDRFSLYPSPTPPEDSAGNVPFWPIFESLLGPSNPIRSSSPLISLLETISFTLTGSTSPATDHNLLRDAISEFPNFYTRTWPQIAAIALAMPALFPMGYIPVLGRARTELRLSRKQAACLVVHQFLRTMRAPEWRTDGTHDFGIWYSQEGQRQESATRAYLKAVMTYFEEVIPKLDGEEDEWDVVYSLRSLGRESALPDGEACRLAEVEVEVVEEYDVLPGSLGLPGGAAVVSANRYVGFGQSATQEEVHVGTSPEACPVVLVTPPLEDDQVLVVQGAMGMVNVIGQRRSIRLEPMRTSDCAMTRWRERRMLFMDALELDLVEEGSDEGPWILPDLRPGNVDREIRKAYTAFCSEGFTEVRTGFWGCGAFGGDPVVKALILWYAASLAGKRLVVVCDKHSQSVAEQLQDLLSSIKAQPSWVAKDLVRLLDGAPGDLVRYQTSSWFRVAAENVVRDAR